MGAWAATAVLAANAMRNYESRRNGRMTRLPDDSIDIEVEILTEEEMIELDMNKCLQLTDTTTAQYYNETNIPSNLQSRVQEMDNR